MSRFRRMHPLIWSPRGSYLFWDRFEAGSAASPRTADPGPGVWTFSDPSGQLSRASGKLTIATGANTPYGYGQATFARQAGRAVLGSLQGDTLRFGWGHLTTADTAKAGAFLASGGSLSVYDVADFVSGIASVSSGVEYELAVVQRSAGCFYLIRGGAYADWTLVWVSNSTTNTGLRVSFASHTAGAGNGSLDEVRALDLRGWWRDDYGIAVDRIAGAVSANAMATMTADALLDFTVTTMPATNHGHVEFRRLDSQNYWRLTFPLGGGKIQLYEVTGGSANLRGDWATTTADGDRIVGVCEGSTITVFRNNQRVGSYIGATAHQTGTGVRFPLGGGLVVSNAVCWPRRVGLGM